MGHALDAAVQQGLGGCQVRRDRGPSGEGGAGLARARGRRSGGRRGPGLGPKAVVVDQERVEEEEVDIARRFPQQERPEVVDGVLRLAQGLRCRLAPRGLDAAQEAPQPPARLGREPRLELGCRSIFARGVALGPVDDQHTRRRAAVSRTVIHRKRKARTKRGSK